MIREEARMADNIPGCQPPVLEKHILQLINGIPFKSQMRIPPVAHFRIFAQVIIAYVHSSGESGQSVHHQNLPVIAVVEAAVRQCS